MVTQLERRDAILRAAIAVFGDDGFASASVDDIAARAEVAKPTVYNHFGDKRTLFLEALRAGAARSNERVLDAIATLDLDADDLRGELERLGLALVGCLSHEEGTAIMRMQIAERGRFDAIDDVRMRNRSATIDALAGRLAQLATMGRLHLDDARRAARQLLALVSDDALAESGFCARSLDDTTMARSVRDGVDTFLAAFGPRL